MTTVGYTYKRDVMKVITLFGKNVKTERVSPLLYRKNPAFKASMMQADKTVTSMSPEDARAYINIYSPYDTSIRKVDTHIPGAMLRTLHTPGHLLSIGLLLTILQSIVIREALR